MKVFLFLIDQLLLLLTHTDWLRRFSCCSGLRHSSAPTGQARGDTGCSVQNDICGCGSQPSAAAGGCEGDYVLPEANFPAGEVRDLFTEVIKKMVLCHRSFNRLNNESVVLLCVYAITIKKMDVSHCNLLPLCLSYSLGIIEG